MFSCSQQIDSNQSLGFRVDRIRPDCSVTKSRTPPQSYARTGFPSAIVSKVAIEKVIPPFLGAVVDALGTNGYAGGFFAYVVLAVMAIAVSVYFWHLDRGAKLKAGAIPKTA